MIFACEYCGGSLDAIFIVGCTTAWSAGCYMLVRVFRFLRRKP